MSDALTLIGDGIENPHNARAMMDAAAMFGAACLFLDHGPLARSFGGTSGDVAHLPLAAPDSIEGCYVPLIALDNLPGAASAYGLRPPPGGRPALVAGNERRGVSSRMRARVDTAIQIPLASGRLNTLNVAAASAVALYYLARGGGGGERTVAHPSRRRPELLLLGAGDHAELGSGIRSAAAFGWERALVEDREGVWFGVDRVRRAEGRAAARRHRNAIRLVPVDAAHRFAYRVVTIVSTRGPGSPLHRADLARGPEQLLVLPDEGLVEREAEAWDRLGARVQVVTLTPPAHEFPYRYRLIATIALAEAARQVGRPAIRMPRRGRQAPSYDSALATLADERGETVYLDDLDLY